MTSPFDWNNKRPTPKEFLPRRDVKGTLPPIVLPNSSKYLRPAMQEKKEKRD